MKRGICQRKKKFYGLITVTDRGQIAIPVELRKELSINTGEKLLVVKREDGKGFNLLKTDVMDSFLSQIAKD